MTSAAPSSDTPDPEDDVTADTAGDGAGDDVGDGADFDALVAKLTGGGAEASKGAPRRDPMDMFMLMMMNERREAKAEKAQFLKMMLALATPLLPKLLEKKETDPLLMTMITSLMSGKNQEQFTQSMMQMQQANAEANAKMTRDTFEATAKIREEMTQRQMDAMEARLEKNDAPASSPVTEIIREMRLLAEPLIAAKLGAVKLPSAQAQTTAPGVGGARITASNPPANIDAPKDVVPIILRALKNLQQAEPGSLSPSAKASMRAKIAITMMDHPQLAQAVLDEDTDTVTEICKPYVIADADMMGWVATDGVGQWLANYLTFQIAPVLDSMKEAEERDNGTYVEEVETDAPSDDAGEPENIVPAQVIKPAQVPRAPIPRAPVVDKPAPPKPPSES